MNDYDMQSELAIWTKIYNYLIDNPIKKYINLINPLKEIQKKYERCLNEFIMEPHKHLCCCEILNIDPNIQNYPTQTLTSRFELIKNIMNKKDTIAIILFDRINEINKLKKRDTDDYVLLVTKRKKTTKDAFSITTILCLNHIDISYKVIAVDDIKNKPVINKYVINTFNLGKCEFYKKNEYLWYKNFKLVYCARDQTIFYFDLLPSEKNNVVMKFFLIERGIFVKVVDEGDQYRLITYKLCNSIGDIMELAPDVYLFHLWNDMQLYLFKPNKISTDSIILKKYPEYTWNEETKFLSKNKQYYDISKYVISNGCDVYNILGPTVETVCAIHKTTNDFSKYSLCEPSADKIKELKKCIRKFFVDTDFEKFVVEDCVDLSVDYLSLY